MTKQKDHRPTKETLLHKAWSERPTHLVDAKFKEENMWIYYILQSLLATLVLFVVLLVLRLNTPLIVAALGSSAFIVFAMPKSVMSQPRNVIGGHLVGIIGGGIIALLLIFFGNGSEFLMILGAASSVGLSTFIMVVTDTEHPPAGSTALGIVIHSKIVGDILTRALFIVISALILTIIKHVLNPKLKDLV